MRKLTKAMIPLLGAAVVVAGAVAASGATSASASVRPTIINGHPASEAYPLVYVGGCTGILIKSQWALTAKHCGSPSSVRAGTLMQHSGGTVVSVSQTVPSPAADISLLHLATAVSATPSDVAQFSPSVGQATRIVGWGQTCPTPGCGGTPEMANELDTSIVADSKCSGIDGPHELCTNNPNGNAGACYGDSGGPQFKKVTSGKWALVGITSRSGNGSSTCATGPSIYTDVTATDLRTWISQTVGGLTNP